MTTRVPPHCHIFTGKENNESVTIVNATLVPTQRIITIYFNPGATDGSNLPILAPLKELSPKK